MAQESIFPEIRVASPRILCECVGAAITRVAQLGRVTEPCLSTHIQGESAIVAEANRVVN